MDNLNLIVAENLKRIRKEKKLSLDSVAVMAGVSKSMIGQIERGESSPTISMLWKIASGLRISFTELVSTEKKEVKIVSSNDLKTLIIDNGRYRILPFFPYEENRPFEMYNIEIDSSGYLKAESHGERIEEYITVFEGELTLKIGEEEYTISKNSAIRFDADKAHEYINKSSEMIKLCMVVYYSKS